MKFSLCYFVGANILDPRAVECIISPGPKRMDRGNEGGLPIKLLDRKPGSKEAMIVGRDVIGRSLRLAKVVIGGRDGIG